MDAHKRPYKCPDSTCARHINGFARKDNLNAHVKTHRKAAARNQRVPSDPLLALGSRPQGIRKQLSRLTGKQRKRLVSVLLLCLEIGFDDEDGGYADGRGDDGDDDDDDEGRERSVDGGEEDEE
jgi:hypothetical protein